MLDIDASSIFDLRRKNDTVGCRACFPPERLIPDTVRRHGVRTMPAGEPYVEVPLEIRLSDIWLVAENVHGTLGQWFCDPKAIASRKIAFEREQRAWSLEVQRPPQ